MSDKIGTPVGPSEWFKGEMKLRTVRLAPVRVHWLCPQDGCAGEMKPNGLVWPTAQPGYHHTCTSCGYTCATTAGRFPRVEYEETLE